MGGPVTEPGAPGPASRARAVTVLAATGAVILLIDLVTKELALRYLADRESVRLLGGAVYLTVTRNSGAAFSFGRDYTFIFPLITLLVVGWIAWTARRLRSVPWGVALGLVLGGALGNLTDRMFRAPGPFLGHVVDMVSLFDDRGQVWPVFNVADSALMTGVGLALLLEVTGRLRDGTRARANPRRDPGASAERGGAR
ncbi:MAG TPA: signal peptidase II [Pilimelia sp.]|nr:signal peptidase II [Pilimelia sp.]